MACYFGQAALLLGALLLSMAVAPTGAEVAPSRIGRVVELLVDLQNTAIDEGKAEAKTYDKFACFCKDMSEEKTTAIQDAEAEADTLRGNIEKNTADREAADEDAKKATENIETIDEEIKEAKYARAKDQAVFVENQLDLEKGTRALRDAIDTLKASETKVGSISLESVRSVRKTVGKAVALADAMGLVKTPKARQALGALLQTPDFADQELDTSGDGYEFKSGSIVEILTDLETSFKEQLSTLEADEEASRAEHESLMETKKGELKAEDEALATAKEASATATTEIARDTQDLTIISATLRDDQAYLLDLAAKCESKAKLWDDRTAMRAEEISALGTAITILKDLEKEGGESEEAADAALVEKRAKVSKTDEDEVPSDEEGDTEGSGIPDFATLSFLQTEEAGRPLRRHLSSLAKRARHRSRRVGMYHRGSKKGHQKIHKHMRGAAKAQESAAMEGALDQVVSLLRGRAMTLKSQSLAALATAARKDPFAKVKVLIQELIERLLQEAADEASHKGWCDEQMGKAKQQREIQAEDIKKLNTEMEGQEAKINKLKDENDTLTTELAELKDSLSKANAIREDEKAENEAAAKEAREAQKAVEKAMDALDKFYKKAAQGLLQVDMQKKRGVDDDTPDAGFDEGYKGQQGGGKGVIGMLEVVASDFAREAKEADEMEKKQAAEFLEFERTSKVSISQKTQAKENIEAELSDTEGGHADAMTNLKEFQKGLDSAMEELESLRPSCVDTGESTEERAAKREAEIEALREALKILDDIGK